jgi:hypothetical protein
MEAGHTPAVATVEAVLNKWETFAEELFFQFIDTLGIQGFRDSEN